MLLFFKKDVLSSCPMRWLFFSCVGVLALGAFAVLGARHVYRTPGPLTRATIVVIPHGGLDSIAETLTRAGVIRTPLFFKAAALSTGAAGALRAGELNFPAAASLATVLDTLRFGRPIQHFVTIPEGLTAAQISTILAHADGLTGDLTVPPEGSILPDTYAYTRGTLSTAIVTRAQRAMDRTLAADWASRSAGLPLHNQHEALILASIVEREAKLPPERAMIARVFLNRLAAHMRLQADPTALYGATGGTFVLDRPLAHDDLARNDPYNTYMADGLPAGPICSPGAAALAAVTHPAAGDALYFVADGTGGHVFATSLATHNENVSRLAGRRADKPLRHPPSQLARRQSG